MTDIVEQLRNYGLSHLKGTPSVIAESADEIERLRARIEKLEMDVTTLRMAWNIQYENQKAAWRRTQELEEEKHAKTDG